MLRKLTWFSHTVCITKKLHHCTNLDGKFRGQANLFKTLFDRFIIALPLYNIVGLTMDSLEKRNQNSFVPCILLPCQSLSPTLPTMKLNYIHQSAVVNHSTYNLLCVLRAICNVCPQSPLWNILFLEEKSTSSKGIGWHAFFLERKRNILT